MRFSGESNSMNETENCDSALPGQVFVYAEDERYLGEARAFAQDAGLSLLSDITAADGEKLIVVFGENGVTLNRGKLSLRGDFTAMLPRIKPNNLNGEMIVNAARLKGHKPSELTVFDATAGLGEDSFLLAASGYSVTLYEYDCVIAALLRDSLRRAEENPQMSDIAKRMTLHAEDSIKALAQLKEAPHIVLLDPMFPARQKSGLIKKKFQLLQQLETPCVIENELLDVAMGVHPRKIIIKRPLKSGFLAEHTPDYSIKGTSVRYDCILCNGNQ